MLLYSLKLRSVSLFVVAFVCLNAGSAFCLAFCGGGALAETQPQGHCAAHEDRTRDDRNASFQNGGPARESCSMTVSFISVPLDHNQFTVTDAAIVTQLPVFEFKQHTAFGRALNIANYRGPPLIDRRIDRLKHRIIRI